ncbi:protodermal factor 1-like [Pecten maximus]|uniref:protodermal factor 1-like n=1 Tax=Pecten maximus TaxID=6579 RepID=UPI001458CF2A|nr:protodermal factor 1-like [Pecten maximus]
MEYICGYIPERTPESRDGIAHCEAQKDTRQEVPPLLPNTPHYQSPHPSSTNDITLPHTLPIYPQTNPTHNNYPNEPTSNRRPRHPTTTPHTPLHTITPPNPTHHHPHTITPPTPPHPTRPTNPDSTIYPPHHTDHLPPQHQPHIYPKPQSPLHLTKLPLPYH